MSDIYAEFGVTNAVISEPSEGYNAEMASKPVAVRDGDDEIVVNVEEEAEASQNDGEPEETQNEPSGEPQEGEEGDEPGESGESFEAVGDVPEELTQAVARVTEGETAFNDMVADAVNRGMTQDSFEGIANEYIESGKISDASYAELAKIGYSKSFIDSFIAGQEAISEQYVGQIVAYAGGQAKYNALMNHLETNSPESVKALETAIDARDLTSVKAIINLAANSVRKTFGKPSERTMTERAKPAKATSQKSEGFTSQADMVAAMRDKRYGRDAAYTKEVERKVRFASF